MLEHLKKEESLFCLDDVDVTGKKVDIKIYGSDEVSAHRRLDIIFKPCTPQQLNASNAKDQKTKCIVDLKNKKALADKLRDTIDYVGEPELIMFQNNK